ncbi:MAG: uracil-DNA glycosylase [Candidatus Kapabacteria bacterium]|nr:uracil-DNA glycosylase [Candidatus Kapabacteria bacterium]
MACPLGKTRRNFVFGTGNPNADILIIGEGPGAEEDAQGKPFVGRSGQLLTKIIEAIKFTRDEVFIANIVKCRPPENRRPEVNEIDACEPYLKRQIDLIKPQFILALGLTAVDTLFKKKHKMGDIRGKLQNYHGIPTLATYHPAALLRNPNLKRDTWEDVKFLRRLYDEKNANQ